MPVTPAVRALSTFKKYLTSAGISFEPSKTADIALVTPKGKVDVVVAMEPTEPRKDVLVLDGKALNGRKLQVAVDAFLQVTKAAGLGVVSPVPNRGEAPSKKLHFAEHFDEVVMRHTEFRKSPNLSEEKVKEFKPIIVRLAKSFYNRNRNVLDTFGADDGDLTTYGMVWLHNFFGVHRKPTNERLDDIRLFTQYMKQRQVEFLDIIRKKSRNVLPEEDTLATALYGEKGTGEGLGVPSSLGDAGSIIERGPVTSVHESLSLKTSMIIGKHKISIARSGYALTPFFDDPRKNEMIGMPEETDEAYVNKHTALDLSNETRRRKSATALLEKGLAAMDHEKLLLTLTNVVQGASFCDDTRREAIRRLQSHYEKCSRAGCLAQRGSLIEVDEDVPGVDALGA